MPLAIPCSPRSLLEPKSDLHVTCEPHSTHSLTNGAPGAPPRQQRLRARHQSFSTAKSAADLHEYLLKLSLRTLFWPQDSQLVPQWVAIQKNSRCSPARAEGQCPSNFISCLRYAWLGHDSSKLATAIPNIIRAAASPTTPSASLASLRDTIPRTF